MKEKSKKIFLLDQQNLTSTMGNQKEIKSVRITIKRRKIILLRNKLTYINAKNEDLKKLKLSNCRISLADFMRSKPVDVFIIILIILYTLLVIVFFAVDDVIDDEKEVELTLHIIELCFLFAF